MRECRFHGFRSSISAFSFLKLNDVKGEISTLPRFLNSNPCGFKKFSTFGR